MTEWDAAIGIKPTFLTGPEVRDHPLFQHLQEYREYTKGGNLVVQLALATCTCT